MRCRARTTMLLLILIYLISPTYSFSKHRNQGMKHRQHHGNHDDQHKPSWMDDYNYDDEEFGMNFGDWGHDFGHEDKGHHLDDLEMLGDHHHDVEVDEDWHDNEEHHEHEDEDYDHGREEEHDVPGHHFTGFRHGHHGDAHHSDDDHHAGAKGHEATRSWEDDHNDEFHRDDGVDEIEGKVKDRSTVQTSANINAQVTGNDLHSESHHDSQNHENEHHSSLEYDRDDETMEEDGYKRLSSYGDDDEEMHDDDRKEHGGDHGDKDDHHHHHRHHRSHHHDD